MMTGQLKFSRNVFEDDQNIENYIDKKYSKDYVPVETSFTSYTTTFLNDPTMSHKHFVILDEIAIDKVDLEFDDSRL